MTGPEILNDLENDQINLWSEHNSIVWNRIMLNVWIKWTIDFRLREDQQDKDIGPRPTKYEVHQVRDFLYPW